MRRMAGSGNAVAPCSPGARSPASWQPTCDSTEAIDAECGSLIRHELNFYGVDRSVGPRTPTDGREENLGIRRSVFVSEPPCSMSRGKMWRRPLSTSNAQSSFNLFSVALGRRSSSFSVIAVTGSPTFQVG